MEDSEKLARITQKGLILEKTKELGIAKEFIEVGDKITGLESKIDGISEKVDTKLDSFIGSLSEELKKKLDEELVYEVDEGKIAQTVLAQVVIPPPIKGEPGAPGENYVLTSKDKEEIASSIPVPVVEKVVETVIERTEVEKPIVNNITKEVVVFDEFEEEIEDIRGEVERLEKLVRKTPQKVYHSGGGAAGITQLTGDVTAGPGSSSQVATLATVNSNVGTFASVTVNGKGLVTAATALSGDITSSGATTTLATVNSNVGSFTNASITVNGKGLITAASSGSTPEVPLTFSTGLTRTVDTITADISTGIAGSQTIYGGTAANEDLTIQGTVHATKTSSYVILQPSGGFVGIGTTAPASLLEAQGGLTTTGSVLTLGTKEPTVVANDILGRVNFYAPLDSAGSDANLLAASVVAIAEGTFSATSNATSLQFRTGASEIATTKMIIKSDGKVGIGTLVPDSTLHVEGTVFVDPENVSSGGANRLIDAVRTSTSTTADAYPTLVLRNRSNATASMADIGFFANDGLLKGFFRADGQASYFAAAGFGIAGTTNHPFYINTNNTTKLTISAAGNTLIERSLTVGDSTTDAGDNNVYVVGDVSALTFTDRTPYYDGDAIEEIKNIKGKDGKIDHDTLPAFAQKMNGEEPGRDLGAMISILVKSVQQLTERLEALENK